MNVFFDVVIGLASAGVFTALIKYFGDKRRAKIDENKQELDEFKKVFEVWQEDNKRLREREKALLEEVVKLREEVADLRNKIVLLESAHQDLPLPAWLKDTKGVMLAVNAAYEDTFLVPRGFNAVDYIGHTDHAVWPEDIANQYQKHDKMVLRSGKMWHGSEKIPNNDGEVEEWSIIKYVRYSGRTKIGIAGIAIPKYYE